MVDLYDSRVNLDDTIMSLMSLSILLQDEPHRLHGSIYDS
jgi:hypothetical protein